MDKYEQELVEILNKSRRLRKNTNEETVDEGAVANTLVGLAALTAMCLPASAKTNGGTPKKPAIVQTANPEVSQYSRKQRINIVARTIFKEAEGEGKFGQEMVASTIFTRAHGNRNELPKVCSAPSQYSCWRGMTAAEWNPKNFKLKERTGAAWDYAVKLATQMEDGTFVPRGDYTHYFANRGPHAIATPHWAVNCKGKQVGNHIFFTGSEIKRGEMLAKSGSKTSRKV